MAIRVGINGFGRIGRVVTRALSKNKDFELVHINDLGDAKTLAHLLQYDSVHGRFEKAVKSMDGGLSIDGKNISVSAVKDPAEIPWGTKGVDIVFECTGVFTKKADCQNHLKGGAKKVLISAPATDEDITIVYGVNHEKLEAKHNIVSNGSCTTNCLAPLAKVIHQHFGIQRGLMTTIHSYTNDQRILDLPHKDLRRARAAALSMIPTSTGAAKAIGLVMPELKGKLNGFAMRVPTPNVSVVDLTVDLEKSTTVEEINKAVQEASAGNLRGVLEYCAEPLVSTDFNGSPSSSIFDSMSTMVIDGKMAKLISWYDNETGFSYRMLDVARCLAKFL